MRLSRYNYIRRFPDGFVGVYNTAANTISFWREHEFGLLQTNSGDSSDRLRELGIVVEDEADELMSILRLERVAASSDFDVRLFTILTTTACNARCGYCYERGWNDVFMSENTARATADYILANSTDGDEVHLWWFGGEPLLNMKAIRLITGLLRESGQRPIVSKVTTNGSLITSEIAKELPQLGINSVQVTVDGLGSKHDATKAYSATPPNALEIGSSSPFAALMYSIDLLLAQEVDVQVRVNLGLDYQEELDATLAFFESRFQKKRPSLYFSPIDSLSESDRTLCSYGELSEFYRCAMNAWASWNRIEKPDDLLYPYLTTHCGACVSYLYKVNPDGTIGKCHRDKGYIIGNVFEGRTSGNAIYYDFDHPRECLACVFLPSCHGGCRYKSLHADYPSAKCCTLKYDIDARLDLAHKLYACGSKS